MQHVLWAYRTTQRKPTNESPYALAYGMEAVIPTEAILPTIRTITVEQGDNDGQIGHSLDLLEEKRERAAINLANYQNATSRYFNKKVRHKTFRQGDRVLKRVVENTKDNKTGKFNPIWEGPYEIVEVFGKGAYKLKEVMTGKTLPRPWNAIHLRRHYA